MKPKIASLFPFFLFVMGSLVGAQVTLPSIIGDLRFDPEYGLYHSSLDGDTITWPPGVYRMGADPIPELGTSIPFVFFLHPNDTTGFRQPRTNLTINAAGVTILVDNPAISVGRFVECDGIEINGLTVDYDHRPNIESTIESVDFVNHSFDVLVDPDSLTFGHSVFTYGEPTGLPNTPTAWGAVFNPTTLRLKENTGANYLRIASYTSLGPGRFRLQVVPTNPSYLQYLAHFSPGDRFFYSANVLGANMFDFIRCNPGSAGRPPASLRSITALASPHFFVHFSSTPNTDSTLQAEVIDCTVKRSGPLRLVSVNGDCVHASDCRVGPLVEGCIFEDNGDDAIFFYGRSRVYSGTSGLYSTVLLGSGPRISPGDTLQIFSGSSGATSTGIATSIARQDPSNLSELQPLIVSFQAPVVISAGDLVWNLNQSSPGFIVRNTVFRRPRGGIKLSAPNGIFTGNTVEQTGDTALYLANRATATGGEGPVPEGQTVTGNTFRNCALVTASSPFHAGATVMIGTFAATSWDQWASVESCRNITFSGNTIEDWKTCAVYARAAKQSSITPLVYTPNKFKGSFGVHARAIDIQAPASSITLDKIIAYQATGMQYVVRIGSGVDMSVTAANVFPAPGTAKLEDLRP